MHKIYLSSERQEDIAGPAMAFMELTDVSKAFGDRTVLRNVSLAVEKGEVVSIIGASGSGKSTLLRCINLLEVPQSGHLRFLDRTIDYAEVTRGRMRQASYAVLRQRIGMVFQSFNLWPHMTVRGNVTEGPVRVLGLGRAEADARAEAILAKVGLSEKIDAWPARSRAASSSASRSPGRWPCARR